MATAMGLANCDVCNEVFAVRVTLTYKLGRIAIVIGHFHEAKEKMYQNKSHFFNEI